MSSPLPPYIPDSQSQNPSTYPFNGKIMIVAVAALLVVTSLVLLLHVYAKWWFIRHSPRRSSSFISDMPSLSQIQHLSLSLDDAVDTSDGLDASVVASLPIFVHKSDEQKIAVECVICLSTMVDDEKGRILPKCRHVFHVGCIDMWLHSHSTCPICRAGVVPVDAAAVSVRLEEVGHDPTEVPGESGSVSDEQNSQISVELEVTPGLGLESQMQKDSSSSLLLSSASSSSSSSSSLSCSLKRMLSRGRSESKVFPSTDVNGSS